MRSFIRNTLHPPAATEEIHISITKTWDWILLEHDYNYLLLSIVQFSRVVYHESQVDVSTADLTHGRIDETFLLTAIRCLFFNEKNFSDGKRK